MDADNPLPLLKQHLRRYSPRAAEIVTLLETNHSAYVAYRASAYLLYLKSTLNTKTLREPRRMRPTVLSQNATIAALVDQAATFLTEDLRSQRHNP